MKKLLAFWAVVLSVAVPAVTGTASAPLHAITGSATSVARYLQQHL